MSVGGMRIGVGLPSSVPGAEPAGLADWVARAEEGPFSSLGVVDRMVYRTYEPMTLLAWVAASTSRVGIATTISISPLRDTAMLLKEAASLSAVSGGRFTLGVSIGARHDDYEALGVRSRDRGKRLTSQLRDLARAWDEEGLCLQGAERPRVLVGGASDVAFWRTARFADGYIMGGGPPRLFERSATSARLAWRQEARPGEPLLWAQGYFALGADAEEAGRSYMLDYYAFAGPFAESIADSLLTSPQSIVQFVRGYADAGCDELLLMPTVSSIEQLERLTDVIGAL